MAPSRGGSEQLTIPDRLSQTLEGHQSPVHVCRYNHGAKYVLSGSADRTVRLWNPASGKEIKCYRGHAQEVLGLDIAHDNAKFASCGGDRTVFVWDVASGTILRRLQGHFGKVHCVAFSSDAQVLATAGFDAKIMLWDMRASARDPIQTLKDFTSSITSLYLLPSPSPSILSSSTDGHVRSYDLRLGQLTEDLVGSPIVQVIPSPQSPGDTLLISSTDGKVRIFDRSNGGLLQTFEGFKGGERGARVGWGYGEGSVLVGDEEGRVWGYNVLDAKPIKADPEKVHKRAITWLETSPNGKEMITASLDGTIKVWARSPPPPAV